MPRLCFALDLVDDPKRIAEYERWHRPENVWPEVTAAIKAAGVTDLEIFRVENRLFMIMEVSDEFSAEAKADADAKNPRVVAWEELMWQFQKALPSAKPGEKWIAMKRIYSLPHE
ncbi:MAG TPA: L-rhamnose mutarotase [Steroidobacteraceae bacterium]|nr:L-rhamnose mutarotase [Steroidobacteraceae bacterium]